LHHLNELPNSTDHEYLLRVPEIHALKDYQDFEGNTPAHTAAHTVCGSGMLLPTA